MRPILLRLTALLLLWPLAAAADPTPDPAVREAFVARATERYGLAADEVAIPPAGDNPLRRRLSSAERAYHQRCHQHARPSSN